ncbi:hypothetical protein CEXT_697381 [Caerostris extrusa]|uniref:Uncharacterized protein n=1 Tax=Caerostris extrusa TaxID=172846 RepID=A0AAV4SUW6_CAEEX|nr:hypothetical protein CEXT_697381 [Caerostris extrusa]
MAPRPSHRPSPEESREEESALLVRKPIQSIYFLLICVTAICKKGLRRRVIDGAGIKWTIRKTIEMLKRLIYFCTRAFGKYPRKNDFPKKFRFPILCFDGRRRHHKEPEALLRLKNRLGLRFTVFPANRTQKEMISADACRRCHGNPGPVLSSQMRK